MTHNNTSAGSQLFTHYQLEGLSLNSSNTTDDDIYKPQRVPIGRKGSFSSRSTEAEDILIEIESRKLKERRAHEEIKSGRFRHPNILTSKGIIPFGKKSVK